MSRAAFFVLLLVAFIDSMGVGLVYPLFSSMLFSPEWHILPPDASAGMRGFWLGILISISPLIQTVLSPFVGSLSDRLGRRPLILGTFSCGVFAYLLAVLGVEFQSLWLLLLGRAVFGVAASNYSAANACIADVSSSEEKAGRFAKMSMAFGAGFAVGPLLGGVLVGDGVFLAKSFLRPFFVSGLLSLLNTIAIYLWLPETRNSPKTDEVDHPLRRLIRDVVDIPLPARYLLLAVFLFCFGWGFYGELIPVWWVTQFHMSPAQVGTFFTYGAVWYVMTCWLIVPRVTARFSHIRIFETAAFLLSITIGILFFSTTESAFWWLIPLQNIALAFFFPIGATVLSEHASEDHQGKIMGLHASAECLGVGVGPAVSGVFLGVHLLMPIVVGCLMTMFGGFLIRYARKKVAVQTMVST